MTIRTKVIGGVLAVFTAAISIAFATYVQSRTSTSQLALTHRLFLPLSRDIAQLQSQTQSLADNLRRFYFRTDDSLQSSAQSRAARDLYPYVIVHRFEAIEALLERNGAGARTEFLQTIRTLSNRARMSFVSLSAQRLEPNFQVAYAGLFKDLAALMQAVDSEAYRVTSSAQYNGRSMLILGLALALVALLGAVAVVVLSARALNSLPELTATVRNIADGDFSRSLKVRPGDQNEVAELARQFNRMLEALTERDHRIQTQQKELLQHERLAAVGQLSAEIVHEIRNPLNAISLNIDWLQNEMPSGDGEVSRTLVSIAREVERLHQITEQYLIRARVERDENATTELNSLIREILEFSREEDKSHRIQVECELSGSEIHVLSERSRMKQALLNILKNAKEAMPQGGTLRVRTEQESNVSRLRIEDTGYGMNESTLRKTFQPFFTTKTNGTGLGLLLTKEIIEEARGSIECRSEIGKGTAFTLQFPL